ncbi:hypothetical protein F3Y22_tig00008468pilonHSYRG00005 [Hibiscus syriacus]|uniref:TTF-type domain-containing protein n=1 Tax=Hibiscus syriacus TaxID=106335 RepID=A0A6A3CAG3_HIBSY|nr:hypothetical protein F3Y22_tig00008468pilonHSYRG00005 [Hibiscus syriacus]
MKLDVGDDGSSEGSSKRNSSNEVPQRPQPTTVSPTPMASIPTTINVNDLLSDPVDRPKITSYHPNQKDEIRRAYWIKGPCQPRGHTFPSKKIGPKLRRFIVEWFDEFDWLEYSIKEDKAYCLCCYLFGDIVGQQGGRDAFVMEGFSTWSKKKSLYAHVVDESSDVSKKEQMAMVLRYVDRLGVVNERFIGVVHVTDTSSLTLKAAIDSVRGQGYDGASNMCGEFNGLKALIIRDNKSAYYVHCFAHQLQLVIVAVAKNHDGAHEFFEQVALVVNVVCASCKRKDIIRESYKKRLQTEIGIGETKTGRGLNQELSLIRAGDTRWGSHYKTIISLMNLFPEVIEVSRIPCQDIFKENIKIFWKRLHCIETLDMSEYYVTPRNRRTKITNQHHFEVEIFNTVLDMQIQEFGDRCSEVSTELLENMAALSPSDSFSKFDKSKLLKLSEMYPDDFSDSERTYLLGQLDIYYHSLLHDDKFANLNGIADLPRLMVETGKHRSFPLVYRLAQQNE